MYSQLLENLREHQTLRKLARGEPLGSNPLDLDQLPISPARSADREGAASQGQRTSMLAA